MLHKVKLVARNGNQIALEAIPRFSQNPNVIQWCGRTFFLVKSSPSVEWKEHKEEPHLTTYMEAFSVEIPEPEAHAKAFGSKHTHLK